MLWVTGITGASVARIAALRPGAGLDSDNALVGTSKDLSCNGQNADARPRFDLERAIFTR